MIKKNKVKFVIFEGIKGTGKTFLEKALVKHNPKKFIMVPDHFLLNFFSKTNLENPLQFKDIHLGYILSSFHFPFLLESKQILLMGRAHLTYALKRYFRTEEERLEDFKKLDLFLSKKNVFLIFFIKKWTSLTREEREEQEKLLLLFCMTKIKTKLLLRFKEWTLQRVLKFLNEK